MNLEGLRALDDGHPADAEAAMRRLIDAAQGLPFLSNDDTSALPKRLRTEELSLDLCDAFDALVKRLDWRLVARVTGKSSAGKRGPEKSKAYFSHQP